MTEIDVGWRTALLFALSATTALAALIIGVRAAERPAFLWLTALLCIWCWHTIPFIIGFAGAYNAFPWLTFAPFSMELWFGPLLYLHAFTLAYGKLRPCHWWWLAPGAAQFVYYCVCFLALGDAPAKFAFSIAFHEPYITPVESILGLCLGIAGMVLVVRLAGRYKRWLEQRHAAADAYDPTWLKRFVMVTCLAIAIWGGFEIWGILFGTLRYIDTYWLYVAIGTIFLVVALDALTKVDKLFPKIAALEPTQATSPDPRVDVTAIAEKIRREGLHRDPDLNLARLARHVGTNESYLSRAINTSAGVNFNRFINEIRVQDVCDRLRDPNEKRSILHTAMDSGFASKATFNRVFREITGETPGRWRRAAKERLNS